jgi:hypothetical protein
MIKMGYLIGLNIRKNKSRVEIMSDFYSTLMVMKEYEKELEYNSDPSVRHYIQAVNTVMNEMQAYIDYLLMDEDSVDGDDIKP